jgi:hypothetical protein
MPDYDDTDRRDDGYDDRGGGGDRISRARAKVSAPGTALMGFGVLSLIMAIITLALCVGSPDTLAEPYHKMMTDMTKNQPQAPGQPPVVPPYDEFKKQLVMQGSIGAVVNAICGVIITLGGARMRNLTGYGLAMAGSILSLIPCTNSCCLIGLPIGLWALIVLVNADVKAGFAAARGTPPDRLD